MISVVDNLLLNHDGLPYVLDLGSSQDMLTISTFLLEQSSMLKSYRVGGGVVVAHKILVSAPVPWIGDFGLGDWD